MPLPAEARRKAGIKAEQMEQCLQGLRRRGMAGEEAARNSEPPSSCIKPTRRDLRELANVNMQAVRENISRRLSTGVEGPKGPTSTRRQSVSVDATNRPLLLSEGATNLGATDLGKDKRSQLKAPITITYEQERYNPDGSLRTVHQLPDQQKSWEEAQKARYIRSREKREHETELTIDEIFNKSND